MVPRYLDVMIILILTVLATATATIVLDQPHWCPLPEVSKLSWNNVGRSQLSTTNCGPNSHYSFCPQRSPPKVCSSLWRRDHYSDTACCKPGCECNHGYLKHDINGKCVPIHECFNLCNQNERYVMNSRRCPRTCANRFKTLYPLCQPSTGCVCQEGFVRLFEDGSGPCIPEASCPQCGPNEVITDREANCPPQSCESIYTTYNCSSSQPTKGVGCNCRDGYLRNQLGMCIPSENCPPQNYDYRCTPTCAVPNPPDCPTINEECSPGYILLELGESCIRTEDCPYNQSCNGDPNARVKNYPLPCPSTCSMPNASPCLKMLDPVGCECLPGYILSEDGGKCILPEECTGGYPCNGNQTFIPCKVWCPTNYCPTQDLTTKLHCDMPSTCYPGCDCNYNYKVRSIYDDTCISATDCPQLQCTRHNEEWDPCPNACSDRKCGDAHIPEERCDEFAFNCHPRCVCKKNYRRNSSGVCIPADQC